MRLFSLQAFLCALYLMGTAIIYPLPQAQAKIRGMTRKTELSDIRRQIQTAREKNQLQEDDRFLIFCNPVAIQFGSYVNYYYHVKYEFETTDILMIAESNGEFIAGSWEDRAHYTDLSGFFEESLDSCDALLIMDPSENFEVQLDDFLQTHSSDISIIRTYEY